MNNLDHAKERYEIDDHRLKIARVFFITYLALVLTFVAATGIITQVTIVHNQKINQQANVHNLELYSEENEAQHQKTQQYIRCIANTLLLPLAQRTDEAFNRCSVIN